MYLFTAKFIILLTILTKASCEICDDFKVKNGDLTFCEKIGDNVYNVTVKCFDGYELQNNITTVNLLTSFDYYDLAQCKSIGCSIQSLPNQRVLEKNNIILSRVFCSRTSLTGYCYSEKSYIDFKCKNNFTLDDRFESLRVKCMSNYSWGLIPFCTNDDATIQIDDPLYYISNDISTQLSTDSQTFVFQITDKMPTTPIDKTDVITYPTEKSTERTIQFFSTSTSLSTNSFQIQACGFNYPRPKNYQNDKIVYNLIPHESVKNGYKIGSSVKFSCQPGYYVINTKLNLKTVCQADYKWSPIADCEKLPCWDKLPKKPLNGERTLTLLLSKYNSSTDGTSVTFRCDPYFDLVGDSKLVCKNGQWNTSSPTCKLKESLCLKKPSTQVNSAKLIYLKHVEIKLEKDLNFNYETLSIYTNASYTCPNNKFQLNQTVKYDEKKVGFVEVACVGKEKWQEVLCAV